MKKIIIAAIIFLAASPTLFAQKAKTDTTQHTKIYTCPMHADVTSNQPGKCPKCGMALTLTDKEQMKMDVTKSYSCPMHTEIVRHDPGKCPKCGRKLSLSSKEQMKTEAMKIYTCPMHPDVALDKEGKCPKCGAELVEKKQAQ